MMPKWFRASNTGPGVRGAKEEWRGWGKRRRIGMKRERGEDERGGEEEKD